MTKPVLLSNRMLRDSFDQGARAAGDLKPYETLEVLAEYLRNETAGGEFSQDAWDVLIAGDTKIAPWKQLVAAMKAKAMIHRNCEPSIRNLGRDTSTGAQLRYQAEAVRFVDALLRGVEAAPYNQTLIDQALGEMEDTQEAI